MSTVNNGPQIVRSGLVLNLDASSVTSYSAISVYKVECYSTFGGGLRSANYTVQYSDDNSTWTTAFTGVMSNNSSCGIIAGTNRNDSNYSKHRYWRYVEGGAVVGHHPRVSRIDFITKSGAVYNLITYTTDNCADSGTYIVGTVSKDFGTTTWRDTSGNGNNGTFGASTAEPTYSNQNGGVIVFDGTNDFVSISSLASFNFGSAMSVFVWHKNIGGDYRGVIANTYGGGGFDLRYGREDFFGGGNNGTILNVYINTSSGTFSRSINAELNVWGNYGFTYTGSSLIAYKNGVSFSTISASGNVSVTSNSVIIGKNLVGSEFLSGNVAIVFIYNRALSALEIMQNFQATKTRFGL